VTAASVVAQSRFPVAPYHYYAMIGSGHTPSRSVDAYWQDCDIPWLTTGDVKHLRSGVQQVISETEHQISRLGMENSAARLHPAGTVALSRTASVGFAAILGRELATSQDFVTWTPFESLDARYLLWVFRAMRGNGDFDRMMYGSTHKTIYYPQLQQLRGPLPSVEVQRRVADMLDVETARIDTLIARNRDALRLMESRFQRVLLETLGDWQVTRTATLRQLGTSVLTGPFGTALSADEYVEGGVPVINPTHIRDGRITPEPHVSVDARVAKRLSRYQLRSGDLVLGRKGDVGRSALATSREAGWICGSDAMVVRPNLGRVDAEWLMWLTRIGYYRQQLEARSRGATMRGLNESVLLSFRVPDCNLAVQRSAVEAARRTWDDYQQLTCRMKSLSDLLRARRRALITAAVTGQIDV
jgi:type I restriction enzyme, S subunit